MTEDTRQGDSEAQTPAQTALPFNVYSRHERFVDELALTPPAYRTLAELGLTMIPILHEDDDVARWLSTANAGLTPPVEVKVAHYADDVFVVWVNTRGRHTPLASGGTAGHAEIVQAALNLLVQQRPEMLSAALDALPRTCVPCAHEPIPPLPTGVPA